MVKGEVQIRAVRVVGLLIVVVLLYFLTNFDLQGCKQSSKKFVDCHQRQSVPVSVAMIPFGGLLSYQLYADSSIQLIAW